MDTPPLGQAPSEKTGGPIDPHCSGFLHVVSAQTSEPPQVPLGERVALLILRLEHPLTVLGPEVEIHIAASTDGLNQLGRAGQFVLSMDLGELDS